SNQWAIETLAGAAEPAATGRRQAQAWLPLRRYEATALDLRAPAPPWDARQHRIRRPSERQALLRSHRNRDGRLGVCMAARQRTRGGSRDRALTATVARTRQAHLAT